MSDQGDVTSTTKGTSVFNEFATIVFGAGVVLVLLPSLALFFGLGSFSDHATAGLPVMAVFGIMILFGALALVAALFQRLDLTNRDQPLALPEGSIRAAIALSLIVLFAIISIMLYKSISEPQSIGGLNGDERTAIVQKIGERLVGVIEERCEKKYTHEAPSRSPGVDSPKQSALNPAVEKKDLEGCPDQDRRYRVLLRSAPGQESTDLAKQLLVLIGTLMTSVTSFYFASRSAESNKKTDNSPDQPSKGTESHGEGIRENELPRQGNLENTALTEEDGDCCEGGVNEVMRDDELPPATGGVQQ